MKIAITNLEPDIDGAGDRRIEVIVVSGQGDQETQIPTITIDPEQTEQVAMHKSRESLLIRSVDR